jgi:hypothetical protein
MKKFLDVLSRYERRELGQLDAACLLGMSERTFRRYCERFADDGELGLRDGRLGKASVKAVPVDEVERMLGLYRTTYSGWNVKHFHEHGVRDHRFTWGYTWTKNALQAAGLVRRATKRGAHRRKRERKPWEGMMLHQDGSTHVWLEGHPQMDLIVTMDDATSTIYSAFLCEEEGTMSTFQGLLETFTDHGLPSSLYTDRGSHYFYTPAAGEAVDKERPTQVGRALSHLGIEHIPAYSPEARGRCERMFGTLQDRLVKELALAKITEVAAANMWLRDVYLPSHNKRFAKPAGQPESAFVLGATATQLRDSLCVSETRIVGRDNTVSLGRLRFQLPQTPGRAHYVKANVVVRSYPDGAYAVHHGPRCVGRYDAGGQLVMITPAGPSVAARLPPSRSGLSAPVPVSPPARRPSLTASARAAKGLPSQNVSTGPAAPNLP